MHVFFNKLFQCFILIAFTFIHSADFFACHLQIIWASYNHSHNLDVDKLPVTFGSLRVSILDPGFTVATHYLVWCDPVFPQFIVFIIREWHNLFDVLSWLYFPCELLTWESSRMIQAVELRERGSDGLNVKLWNVLCLVLMIEFAVRLVCESIPVLPL